MRESLRDKLLLGGFAVFSLAASIIGIEAHDRLNSRSERVTTSRGQATVNYWNERHHNKIVVFYGGHEFLEYPIALTDNNRDYIADKKTQDWMGSEGGFTENLEITPEDQEFFKEAISKVSTLKN